MTLSSVLLVLGLAGSFAPVLGAEPVPVRTVLIAAEDVKYYVVARPRGGEPEYLSDIARRTLRDGGRAGEIFELNKGRPQPGGGRMIRPERIEPGWILVLPADAAGPGVRVGTPPTGRAEAPSGASADQGGGADGSTVSLPSPSLRTVGIGMLVGAVLLVGGATFLSARRRTADDGEPGPEGEAGTEAADGTARPDVDTGFWGHEDEERQSLGRRLFRPRQKEREDDAWQDEDVPGFWPQDGDAGRRPVWPDPPGVPGDVAARPRQAGGGYDAFPPGFRPFGPPVPAASATPAAPVARAVQPVALLPVRAAAPAPESLTRPDLPPLVEYEVSFGDDLVTLAISGRSTAASWRPLPHDVPDGLAVVCLGAASRGCLFLDLGAVSGTVGIKGPADAAARLAEAFVYQLSTDTGRATVALVGEILAELPEGPRVRRVRGLGALALGDDESDPVVAVVPAERAAEPVPSGGPRIVPVRLGGTGASCLMTVTPGHALRA